MPTISVLKLRSLDDTGMRLLQEIQVLRDAISRRAYDYYESRGASHGRSMEDWLRAERELCWVPYEELLETERAVHLMLGLPGVADETIEVTLLPEMIILRSAQRDADSGECRQKALFRQILLPTQIHPESAVIRFENDLLRVSAAKMGPA